MSEYLNNLCEQCSRLSIDISQIERCESSCESTLAIMNPKTSKNVSLSNHTDIIVHQPSRDALKQAAKKGCHLCAIFDNALEYNSHKESDYHRVHYKIIASDMVLLVYAFNRDEDISGFEIRWNKICSQVLVSTLRFYEEISCAAFERDEIPKIAYRRITWNGGPIDTALDDDDFKVRWWHLMPSYH
jgi:hypothetical protein